MISNMKSVMVFDPKDTEEETANKFLGWLRHNKPSAIADKYVPDAEETRKMLNGG